MVAGGKLSEKVVRVKSEEERVEDEIFLAKIQHLKNVKKLLSRIITAQAIN